MGQIPACTPSIGTGMSPQICVVMDHETASAVKVFRQSAPVFTRIFNQVEQRLVQFRKVADFSGPVVHLRVDIDGVLAVPGRLHLIVPFALKIRGHRSGTAARNQQVTSKLKVECFECEIVSLRTAHASVVRP